MGKTIRLILFYVDYCTVLYISQREQPYAVARFIWGAQNQAPAPDPRGVFEGAAEHLRGGARPPRRALPRREVPARRSSPAASPADPRPPGRAHGVPGAGSRRGSVPRTPQRDAVQDILYGDLR